MNASPAGIAFTRGFERCVLTVYLDQLGYPTIGWGHRVPAVSLAAAQAMYPSGITQDEAEAIWETDLRVDEGGVRAHVDVDLPQGIFDALVDLCHNCGPACLVGTRCLAALNVRDFATARVEFLGFVHGVDPRTHQRVVLEDLIERRKAAAEQLWDAPEPAA